MRREVWEDVRDDVGDGGVDLVARDVAAEVAEDAGVVLEVRDELVDVVVDGEVLVGGVAHVAAEVSGVLLLWGGGYCCGCGCGWWSWRAERLGSSSRVGVGVAAAGHDLLILESCRNAIL